MRQLYYNIRHGISNLIYYFRVIWEDRSWDSHYYFTLLLAKIERQRKRLQSREIFVGQNYVIIQMRACEILLDKLIKDEYYIKGGYQHDDVERLTKILNRYLLHWWD